MKPELKADNSQRPTGVASQPAEREKRQWWAVAEDDVQLVTGYSCAPTNPEMWWCPKVGCSMSEKYHLFETEAEAINKLISELTRRIEVAADDIEALKRRLANDGAKPSENRDVNNPKP